MTPFPETSASAPHSGPHAAHAAVASAADRIRITEQLRRSGCVFAEDEAGLIIAAAQCRQAMFAMVSQRVAGVPLEHILGTAEFRGLRIAVTPGVFVPRRRSEWLVAQALAVVPPPEVVLDLCCGSGAVGAALLDTLGDAVTLHAVDIDPVAVACAERNLDRFAAARVYEGDLYEPLPPALRGRVDLIVANAPYVPTRAIAFMPPEARDHEPLTALDGGPDGLDVQRRIIAHASHWLVDQGCLAIEIGRDQADTASELFVRAGFAPKVESNDDLAATVVIGRLLG